MLLMRFNKVETAVQWFSMSHAVFAGFSSHGNSIYNIIPQHKKMYCIKQVCRSLVSVVPYYA